MSKTTVYVTIDQYIDSKDGAIKALEACMSCYDYSIKFFRTLEEAQNFAHICLQDPDAATDNEVAIIPIDIDVDNILCFYVDIVAKKLEEREAEKASWQD